jgi:uncharacterized membrane protein YfcA
MLEAIAVVALGVAGGTLAGLFGVGGGIVFVPTLTLIVGLSQLHAEATSLLAIIPVALLGSWRQTRAGTVRWHDAVAIGLVSAGTAVAGAVIADHLPGRALRIMFAALLVLTAAQLAWRASRTA